MWSLRLVRRERAGLTMSAGRSREGIASLMASSIAFRART
jgi:hypothetical protein